MTATHGRWRQQPSRGERVTHRRAVEALRAGVPSQAGVRALGLGQPEIEDAFTALLEAVSPGQGVALPSRGNSGRRGLLIGGGFGSGKSHTLEHLSMMAAERGFVVSRIVVSKETPLHDPAKFVRAAVDAAVPPQLGGWRTPGTAVSEAVAELDADGPGYAALVHDVTSSFDRLDHRFAATLALLARLRQPGVSYVPAEAIEAVAAFWSGGALRTPDLRRWSREVGLALPQLSAISVRDLARQRLNFLPRLFIAAGWAGWVLLVDEAELIGRYSILQRGRAYAELHQLLEGTVDDPDVPLVSVVAMTDDYEAAVLTDKKDRATVPAKLKTKQTPEADELAAAAVLGMRAIERDMLLLDPANDAELDRAYAALRELHGSAFEWSPPDVPGLERLAATRMRQHVRAWVNEWDLIRLDPTYQPSTEAASVSSNYTEDAALSDEP